MSEYVTFKSLQPNEADHFFHSSCTSKEKQVVFVTNNATKSRKSYKTKFDQLGVEAHVVSVRSGSIIPC